MKIITPLSLDGSQITSNAPEDGFPQWEQEGRETLSDLQAPIFSATGNTLYYMRGNGSYLISATPELNTNHTIGKQDLVSGDLLGDFATVFGIAKVMEVSPDGAWLALIREEDSGFYINVFDIATGQLVYSDNVYASNVKPLLAWSSASDQLAYTYSETQQNNQDLCLRIVSVSTWSGPAQTETIASLAGYPSDNGGTLDGLDWDASGSLFLAGLHILDPFSGPYSCRLAKFSAAGATLANIEIDDQPYNHKMAVNRARGEVIVLGRNVQLLFDVADLSALSTPSALLFKANQIEKSSDGEIYIRTSGSAPRNRRFDDADYAARAAFPDTGDYFGMAYATGYALFGDFAGGYEIVERSTNQLIELINPQVLAGSTFIYQQTVYEALTDTQDRPDMGSLLDPPTWVSLGVVNPLRMIDGQVGTSTSASGPLEVVFSNVDIVDGLALFNLLAQTVLIELVDSVEGVVFSTGEISLVDNTGVTDWYQYFYSPVTNKKDFVFTGLPPYRGADVRVVLTDVSGVLQVGEIALGPIRNLGDTQFGTSVGILDFSRKDRDTFGNFIITERRFSKRANYDISLRTNQIAFAQQLLARLRATPAVFIGAESQPETIIYGFYRSFDIVLSGVKFSECTIEVEGLT